ncbi:MAG TPA: DUF2304 domain-containing protein [Actinophytocola sp.]|uniref:DUF2304 domain-containing protein n=1 Tax=Actinophytocola sp. TaxID=1872138 RepID=UPI002DBBF86E|nr:DUF2304 domain-containing protein [Actinophytocola sp.]HEU5473348.1 DUF2304 domain-containing protein [Actinophytocola sp.]
MLIQYLLIASSIGLLFLFRRRRGSAHTAAGTKIGFVSFVIFGMYAVLRPGDVQMVATWVGVSRGTDLLLYLLVVVFTFATLNAYLRFKELESKYALLVRKVALQHVERPFGADSEIT